MQKMCSRARWHSWMFAVVFGADDEVVIAERAHGAAVVAGEGEGVQSHACGRFFEGVDEVGRVPGGGDGEEDVAGSAEGFELARKDELVAEVVAGGGEDGAVGGEGDGAERAAVDGEAHDELGDEVLGVGGGAAVARDKQGATVAQGVRCVSAAASSVACRASSSSTDCMAATD